MIAVNNSITEIPKTGKEIASSSRLCDYMALIVAIVLPILMLILVKALPA
jgi:hypothetical protein